MSRQSPLDDTLRRVRTSPGVVATMSRFRSLARRFLVVTLVGVGALCGVLAVAFERYVEWARGLMIGAALNLREPYRTIAVLLTPPVVFTTIAVIIRRAAPRAVGANLARVRMAYNEDPKLLGPTAVAATFTATPLSLGAGAPLGPEGPIVVITSGVSAAIGRALRLPKKLVRGMIPVGVAAGIAAVFNTPITGVVFALEEVFGAADRGLLGGVLVGAVAAAVVERALLGGRPLLAAPFSTWSDPRELIGFALVGVVAGSISGLAIAWAHRLKRQWARVMPSMPLRAATAGLLIGGAGLISPSILGVGYDSVSFWLHGGGSARTTALAFFVKTVAFVIAISGGVLGGSFAPSLFIGTALGASIGFSAQHLFPTAGIDPKAFAIIGMGSFFAGLLRSPIAAVLIAIELTRDYELVVPLMLGVSLAVAISRRISRFSIVEQQMIDEGYVEGHDSADPLSHVRVVEAMTGSPLALHEGDRLAIAVVTIGSVRHRIYPVVNTEGRLVGVVTRDTVEKTSERPPDALVRDVMEQPKLVATADDELIEVVRRMQLHGVDRCPVVDSDATGRLIGFLSPSDILRARIAHAGFSEDDVHFDLFDT
ncbi:MAG TPA: chloride channel protein [Thermoanaerobaculia bacterium]|nr:chloride channel protein [Thermoanaerobaculia bacterium]